MLVLAILIYFKGSNHSNDLKETHSQQSGIATNTNSAVLVKVRFGEQQYTLFKSVKGFVGRMGPKINCKRKIERLVIFHALFSTVTFCCWC